MVSVSERVAWWSLCFCLVFPIACGNQGLSQNKATTDDLTPADAVQEEVRPPIPNDSEYKAVIAKLEELFPKDFENARTKPKYKKILAEKLIKLTPDTQSSSERYVMLSESLKMLTADAPELASSIPLLMNCADALAAEFDVNPSKFKSDCLSLIADDAKTTLSSIRQMFKLIIPSIQEAVDRDDYSSATSLLSTAKLISERLLDRRFKVTIDEIEQDVTALESQYKSFLDAKTLLLTDAGNKDAHRIAGLYLGLRKGKWLEAERHIQLVGDPGLQSLDVRTTAETRTSEASAGLADDWWKWASIQETVESKQAKSFAAFLYSDTARELTGLSKIVAEERKSYSDSLPLVVAFKHAESSNLQSESSAIPFAPKEAQSDDDIAKKLEKAKQKYMAVIEATTKPILIQIDRLEVKARQDDSTAKVQSVLLEKERFEKFGVMPSFCDASLLKQRASSHEQIIEAFRIAIRDYNKSKQDAEATETRKAMESVWPEFLDQPEVGGWNPFGGGRLEIGNGVLAITGRGQRSGIVSTNDFPPTQILTINLCASENVRALVGIRIHMGNNQRKGYTSSITGSGDAISMGKIGVEGDSIEVGAQYSIRRPNEFFELRFGFDEFEAATVNVDERHSVGMGPIDKTPAKIGIFVTEGTLVVKSTKNQ